MWLVELAGPGHPVSPLLAIYIGHRAHILLPQSCGVQSLDEPIATGRIPSSFEVTGIGSGPSSLDGLTGTGLIPSSLEVAGVGEGTSFGGLENAVCISRFLMKFAGIGFDGARFLTVEGEGKNGSRGKGSYDRSLDYRQLRGIG